MVLSSQGSKLVIIIRKTDTFTQTDASSFGTKLLKIRK